MDCSMPGLPVHHQLPESTQTHVHWVSDAIQPSHPLLSPSPPALNLSQHQGLFKWVSSSHQVAKVLEFQLQHHSFQWTRRTDLLQDGLVGSPCSPRDSQASSPTTQFKIINSSVLSFLLWGCRIVWCILTSRYLVSLLPLSIIHVSDIFLVGFWSWEISFIMWGCRDWGWQAAGTWVSVSHEMVGFPAPIGWPGTSQSICTQ